MSTQNITFLWRNKKHNILVTCGAMLPVKPQSCYLTLVGQLMLSTLGKNLSIQHPEILFLFSPENRICHFMQVVSIGYNLIEMSKPIFWGK